MDNVRIAGIYEIPDIVKIMKVFHSEKELEGIEFQISMKMRVMGTFYFLHRSKKKNSKYDALIIVESMGHGNKALMHIYSEKGCRGKCVVSFIKEVSEYLYEETDYECFIGFTNEDIKEATLLARLVGFKKIGTLELDSGVKEQVSMITKDMYRDKKYKGVS